MLHKTENNARMANDVVNSHSMLLGRGLSFVYHIVIIAFCCSNHLY